MAANPLTLKENLAKEKKLYFVIFSEQMPSIYIQ